MVQSKEVLTAKSLGWLSAEISANARLVKPEVAQRVFNRLLADGSEEGHKVVWVLSILSRDREAQNFGKEVTKFLEKVGIIEVIENYLNEGTTDGSVASNNALVQALIKKFNWVVETLRKDDIQAYLSAPYANRRAFIHNLPTQESNF